MGSLRTQADMAASIFTQQPGLNETAVTAVNNATTEERNKTIVPEVNNGITEENHNGVGEYRNSTVTEEDNNSSKRGPKKKGEFKKVTLNLDVELNMALDKYILSLKQEALNNGTEAPNKSEWVRDVVEEKLRILGILK